MPTLPSFDDAGYSDLYDPTRPNDGPTLADWEAYMAFLNSVGGLFPDTPRDGEAPELDDFEPSFVPTPDDLAWLNSRPRCPECERIGDEGGLCVDCVAELEACRDEPAYDGPEGWPSWTDGVRYAVSRAG